MIIFPAVFCTFKRISGYLEDATPSLTSTHELSRVIVESSLTSAFATTGLFMPFATRELKPVLFELCGGVSSESELVATRARARILAVRL